MRTTKRVAMWLCLVMLAVLVARADEYNKKTVVTFNGPVEIPGKVLPAGTYVFKLFDSDSDRNIVQIWNKDETQLIATVLAIPDYRLTPADNPIITFEERAQGSPPAIRAWFYPGDNYGYEFVYPKTRATELAAANHKNVPTMADSMSPNVSKSTNSKTSSGVVALKQAPVTAMTPDKNEVEANQAIQTKPGASSSN
ncbi:MAG: hypothetical protein WBQ04_14290 [Candidatus Acidiferrales bacterium]